MLLTLTSGLDSFLQFCTVLVIFLFVLGITWVATKWIANLQKGITNGSNIEVIETFKLTPNKYLQIIRAGEQYLLIAICKDTVTMLTEISAEEIQTFEKSGAESPDFKKIFEKLIVDKKDRKNKE